MKKPAPKAPPKNSGGSQINNQVIGKALDIIKEVASTGNNLIDLNKEKQKTAQAAIKAGATVEVAREKTSRAAIHAETETLRIHAEHHKNKMNHELDMARLQIERENVISANRRREKALDKILDDPDNKTLLVDSYRVLLDDGKQH